MMRDISAGSAGKAGLALAAGTLLANQLENVAFASAAAPRLSGRVTSRPGAQQQRPAVQPAAPSAAALGAGPGSCAPLAAGLAAGALAGAGTAGIRRQRPRERQGKRSASAVPMEAFAAGVKIAGTGSAAPEMRVTNDNLSEIVETSDEWIAQRTGIRSRHVLEPNETLASISAKAAKKALEAAKMSPDEVDLIIMATSSPDDLFGCATSVQAELGCTCPAFDLTAACSGFVFAFVTASQYIRSGTYKNVLVIGADALSRWVDWTDRAVCCLFGDGAGAVALRATAPEDDTLLGFEMGSDGKGACSLGLVSKNVPVELGGGNTGSNGGYATVGMNGQDVFRFATTTVPKVLKSLVEKCDVDPEEIDWLLLHQANMRIMASAAKRLKLPEEKIICNLDEYGNTSAASIPLALDEAVREGKVKEGELIACAGFGAGLSWGGMFFRL